jgi:hypothetical protein
MYVHRISGSWSIDVQRYANSCGATGTRVPKFDSFSLFNGLHMIYGVNEAQLIVLLQSKFEICSVFVYWKYTRSRKWLNTDSIFLYVNKEAKAFSWKLSEF